MQRLCTDWDSLPSNLRKPVPVKDALPLHQACGMVLHFLEKLEVAIPSADYPAARDKVMGQFLLGTLDNDLQKAAEASVPPGDLQDIGVMRPAFFSS